MDSLANLHSFLKNTKLRLKAEYGWDNDFVDAAINEYWRFIYLHKNNPKVTIVPGKVVDKVWHDHILHTREYIDYCTKELGEYFHHDPRDYSNKNSVNDPKPTVELYKKTFGHEPPAKFWTNEVIKQQPIITAHTGSFDCRCGCSN